jgi:hypothetical protein
MHALGVLYKIKIKKKSEGENKVLSGDHVCDVISATKLSGGFS